MKLFPPDSSLDGLEVVKFGIDPTSDRLHLGHLVPLKIVKELGLAGKTINIVLGTFTAQIGDPSGRSKQREMLEEHVVFSNTSKILNVVKKFMQPVEFTIIRNHQTFEELSAGKLMLTLSDFTVQKMLSRDSFRARINAGQSIGLVELMVPICQGIDSVMCGAEIEVGGNDQLFNFEITREIQKSFNQRQQICILTDLINGTDGRKMSKSYDNCIFLDDEPDEIFGKVMSISDDVMCQWIPVFMGREPNIRQPMQDKKELATIIVKEIHGEAEAKNSLSNFNSQFCNRQEPATMNEVRANDVLSAMMTIPNMTKSQVTRLVAQNGIKLNGEVVKDAFVATKPGDVLKKGRTYLRII